MEKYFYKIMGYIVALSVVSLFVALVIWFIVYIFSFLN